MLDMQQATKSNSRGRALSRRAARTTPRPVIVHFYLQTTEPCQGWWKLAELIGQVCSMINNTQLSRKDACTRGGAR
jgi:hypothetical protein